MTIKTKTKVIHRFSHIYYPPIMVTVITAKENQPISSLIEVILMFY